MKLIITIGLPKSGKSTWAHQQGFPVVNPDSIRMALHGHRFSPQAEEFVWAIAHIMVKALFLAGHETVIVDGCHGTSKRRQPWLDRYGTSVRFQVFDVVTEVCIQRARTEGDEEIVPIIEKMAQEWEPLP
jgi:predicted kinase